MLNIFFAVIFTFFSLATALFMGATGSTGFALIALFCAFISFAASVAAMFIEEV
jgi:hypothetical protein